jgi:hypothetical protein
LADYIKIVLKKTLESIGADADDGNSNCTVFMGLAASDESRIIQNEVGNLLREKNLKVMLRQSLPPGGKNGCLYLEISW